MKRILLALAAMVVAVALCWSQNNIVSPPRDAKPASTNAPGQKYPNVDSQGRTTFHVYAPDAKAIRVFNTERVANIKKREDAASGGPAAFTMHIGAFRTGKVDSLC